MGSSDVQSDEFLSECKQGLFGGKNADGNQCGVCSFAVPFGQGILSFEMGADC